MRLTFMMPRAWASASRPGARYSCFRRLLEKHDLAVKMLEVVNAHLARKGQSLRAGTIVDGTIIHAPSSTKNADKARGPEMHQTRKGN